MNMKLEQRLTPQLIQSLQLLQVPLLELEQMIRTELVANPFLEEDAKTEAEPATAADAPDGFVAPAVEEHEENDTKIQKYDWDTYLDAGYERENYRRRGYEEREERETQFVQRTTLAEDLQFQLRMTDLKSEEVKIGEQIIGNINAEG
jgi:RNA polymerase sigma-54 factor